MLMEKEREELVKYGKRLVATGLTKGTGGNLSVFDRKNGFMAITPSGIDFSEIKPENIVILDLYGNIVEGDMKPSSEWEMHLLQYKERDDLEAVIHAHTVYATVLACLNWELPAAHYMIAVAGSSVRVTEYAPYGTSELARKATDAMKDRKAVLLANHGILAGEKNLLNAFNVVEEIEYCSEIYIKAKSVGDPVIISTDEMNLMLERFKDYGQKGSVTKPSNRSI